MYGFVEKAVSRAVEKLEKEGFTLKIFRFRDSVRSEVAEIIPEVADTEALVVGVSTYENDVFPYIRFLLDLLAEKVKRGKPSLVISSYGWAKVADILSRAGFNVAATVEFHGQPDEDDMKKIEEGVEKLVELLGR